MQDEFNKLLKDCKTEEERKSIYDFFRMIACLQKHKRLSEIYSKEK